MSKKIIALIIIGIVVLLVIVSSSGGDNKKEPPVLEEEEVITEQKELLNSPPAQEKKIYAVLSETDNELVIGEINTWQEAGSGGPDNVATGRIPHNTKVEVLESKEVEGNAFYKVRSSVGKVSVLPTDFNLRKEKMEKLPENEWFVPADETFPVEGWVIDSFVTEIKEE